MIFKNLYLILITTPRWQLWALTLLLLGMIPTVWYRTWYGPRKAAAEEHGRLTHALSHMKLSVDDLHKDEPPSADVCRMAIIRGVEEDGVSLEKIVVISTSPEPFTMEVGFSGSYECLAAMIERIEKMSLRWLSFVMTETSLVGTLTPQH